MSKVKALPSREKVKPSDTWNLARLFKSDAEWERGFKAWAASIPGYEKFRGKLSGAKDIAALMAFDAEFDRVGEKLGNYAFLRSAEDQGNSDSQRMKGRYQATASDAAQAASWIR